MDKKRRKWRLDRLGDDGVKLQKLIDVVHAYCCKWRLKANVSKSAPSAVMVFALEGSGERTGIDFQCNGALDVHIKRVVENSRKKVNQLHSVISNRGVNLSARRLLLLSVVRPTLEYGSEVWEGNKSQAASLESVMLGGAKRTLGSTSKTCNEAVRGCMGQETLQGRRDQSKQESVLCGDEWESVSHTLRDCSAFRNIRAQFLLKLQASLGGSYAHFEAMSSLEKSSFVLGNELWEEHYESLLESINIWEERKSRLYGDVECAQHPVLTLQLGILGKLLGLMGRIVKGCVREVSMAQVSCIQMQCFP